MRKFRDTGFVGSDTLEMLEATGDTLYLAGQIGCAGQIVIDVEKKLELLDDSSDPPVQTLTYSYHVSVQGLASLFRYDNFHPNVLHPGHADPHHVHRFRWPGHEEVPGSLFWVGAMGWPTLGDVIGEARGWYWDNHQFLPRANEFATNLRSGWGH